MEKSANLKVPYEEALFHKLMLQAGFTNLFSNWLNEHLNQEDPLSDLILELAFCGDDLSKIISCLHNYTLEATVNQEAVVDLVKADAKRRYTSGAMDAEACATMLYAVAYESDRIPDEPWLSMAMMGYALEDYDGHYLSKEDFERRLCAYLEIQPLPKAEPRSRSQEPGWLQKQWQRIKNKWKGQKR